MGQIASFPGVVGPTAGVPAVGDRANFVIGGTFTAIGVSQPIYAYGTFNCVIWGSTNTTLTIASAVATTGTVASGTGLVNGQTIKSTLVPPGTTFTISATTVTFVLPPGFTSANILAGADAGALFMTTACAGTVDVERSFDGGSTWLMCNIGGLGAGATYVLGSQATAPIATPISFVIGEPEAGMLYRLNCLAYTSGTINYRISGTGAAAMAWAPNS